MQIKPEQCHEIKDEQTLNLLKESIAKDIIKSTDTETTGLDWVKESPFMQTFYVADKGFVIDKRRANPALWRGAALAVLADTSRPLLGHNTKFDLLMLRKEFNYRYTGEVHDTLVQTFLINENESHRLKDQAEKLWGKEASALEHQVKDWLEHHNKGEMNYDRVPFELMSMYAMQDTYLCRKLHDTKFPVIQAEYRDIYETERALVKVLVDMEWTGIRVDVPYLQSLVAKFEQELKLLENQIYAVAGKTFNISSAPQLSDVLYRQFGIKPTVFTDKGAPSTDKEALAGISHPIGNLLLQYSQFETSLHTFVLPWLGFCDSQGVMHPSFNQCGTRSGRFSSNSPNAQQIPKRTPQAKLLRRAFIYEHDRVGLGHDQSQIEMVGFAYYSGDPIMQKALREGQDLHKVTAIEAGIATSAESCTADQRRLGKGANFSVVFGCGAAKLGSFLSQDLYAGRFVSNEEAAVIRNKYRAKFTNVGAFQYRVQQMVRTRPGHYVQNAFGRRCHLSPDKAYVGVNRIVQSWAGDFMKRRMVDAWKYAQGTDLKLYVNVHDELKTQCEPKNWKEHAREIHRLLTTFPIEGFPIPIKCEVTYSETNWAEETEVHV